MKWENVAMNTDLLFHQLEAGPDAVRLLVAGMTDEQARLRPDPKVWTVAEVLAHLCDEESEDFRRRLDMTWRSPVQAWPPMDGQGWTVPRKEDRRSVAELLEQFALERGRSLVWLRSLTAPDWQITHEGEPAVTTGNLLASWAAHDILHLRQLIELRYAWLRDEAAPCSVAYAGDW
jgi:hypothetical protein